MIKPTNYLNKHLNKDYVFLNIDHSWSYLLHSLHQYQDVKTLSDLNYDIEDNIDTFYYLKKSDIEYDVKNNARISNPKAPSSFVIKDDKDIIVAKRDDTALLFIDHTLGFRIQQNLLAIKLFLENPLGRNFDDAGEIMVFPHFLTYYTSKKALEVNHTYQIHNVFFYNAVRGGIPMLGL